MGLESSPAPQWEADRKSGVSGRMGAKLSDEARLVVIGGGLAGCEAA